MAKKGKMGKKTLSVGGAAKAKVKATAQGTEKATVKGAAKAKVKATAQGTEKATVKGNLRAGARAPGSRGPTVNEALAAPPRKVGRTEPPNFKEGAVKAEKEEATADVPSRKQRYHWIHHGLPDAPEEVKGAWNEAEGSGAGKVAKKNAIISACIDRDTLQANYEAPMFVEFREMRHANAVSKAETGMPRTFMEAQLGGEEGFRRAEARGEIWQVEDPDSDTEYWVSKSFKRTEKIESARGGRASSMGEATGSEAVLLKELEEPELGHLTLASGKAGGRFQGAMAICQTTGACSEAATQRIKEAIAGTAKMVREAKQTAGKLALMQATSTSDLPKQILANLQEELEPVQAALLELEQLDTFKKTKDMRDVTDEVAKDALLTAGNVVLKLRDTLACAAAAA